MTWGGGAGDLVCVKQGGGSDAPLTGGGGGDLVCVKQGGGGVMPPSLLLMTGPTPHHT